MLRRTITPDVEQSLRTIVGYLWGDEQKHWEENECPEFHIYCDVQRVAKWLDDGESGGA